MKARSIIDCLKIFLNWGKYGGTRYQRRRWKIPENLLTFKLEGVIQTALNTLLILGELQFVFQRVRLFQILPLGKIQLCSNQRKSSMPVELLT